MFLSNASVRSRALSLVEAEGAVDRERLLIDLGLELDLGTLELHLGVGLDLRRNRSLGARRLARRAPVFQLAMRAGVAVRALAFQLAMRTGVAVRAVAFPLAMRARVAVRAVVFQLAVRAAAAVRAAVLHLAVRARVAVRAAVLHLAMPAPLLSVPHHSLSGASSDLRARAPRLCAREERAVASLDESRGFSARPRKNVSPSARNGVA